MVEVDLSLQYQLRDMSLGCPKPDCTENVLLPTALDLDIHLQLYHPELRVPQSHFPCPKHGCSPPFAARSHRDAHVELHHPELLCEKHQPTPRKNPGSKPTSVEHDETSFEFNCPKKGCSPPFTARTHRDAHVKLHHPELLGDKPKPKARQGPPPVSLPGVYDMPILTCPVPRCPHRLIGTYEWQKHVFMHPEVHGRKYTPKAGHNPQDKYHCLARDCDKWFQKRDQVKKHVDTHAEFQPPAELSPESSGQEKWIRTEAQQAFEEVSAEAGRSARFGPGPDYRHIQSQKDVFSEMALELLLKDCCVGITDVRRTI